MFDKPVYVRVDAVVGIIDKVVGRYKDERSAFNDFESGAREIDKAIEALSDMRQWLIDESRRKLNEGERKHIHG